MVIRVDILGKEKIIISTRAIQKLRGLTLWYFNGGGGKPQLLEGTLPGELRYLEKIWRRKKCSDRRGERTLAFERSSMSVKLRVRVQQDSHLVIIIRLGRLISHPYTAVHADRLHM
jgi:hypothetical protein